jgi:hypothetical protein
MLAAAVGNIDCTKVVVDKTPFNLKELGGPRSVVHRVDEGPSFTNTTYTIDICRPLGKAKHVNTEDQCPNRTRRESPCFVASHPPWSCAPPNENIQSVQLSIKLAKMATATY